MRQTDSRVTNHASKQPFFFSGSTFTKPSQHHCVQRRDCTMSAHTTASTYEEEERSSWTCLDVIALAMRLAGCGFIVAHFFGWNKPHTEALLPKETEQSRFQWFYSTGFVLETACRSTTACKKTLSSQFASVAGVFGWNQVDGDGSCSIRAGQTLILFHRRHVL